jgi:deoxyribonuclease V
VKPVFQHDWNLTPDEARMLQSRLARKVIDMDAMEDVMRVAGVDVHYDDAAGVAHAAITVLDAQSLKVLESVTASVPCTFPVIAAAAQLKRKAELFVCDGQGRAHARRFGIACHFGVLFDVPTIGCAKTRLTGQGAMPDTTRASMSDLTSGIETVGRILRTRDGVQPVYVSIGHRIGLDTACDWILRLTPRFRLPETTRAADKLSRRHGG